MTESAPPQGTESFSARLRAAFHTLTERAGLGSRIARNSLFLMAGEVFARAVNLLVVVVLYRYLGAQGSGTLRFVVSYGAVIGILAEFGLSRAAIRDIARAPASELGAFIGRIDILRAALSLVYLAATAALLVLPIGESVETRVRFFIVMWSASVVLQAWRRNAEVVFQAVERMQYHSLFLVISRTLAALLICGVILAGGGLAAVFAAYIAADLFDALAANWFVRRHICRAEYSPDRAPLLRLMRDSVPFGLQLAAQQVHAFIDSMLIYFLYGTDRAAAEKQIGWYQAAFQIVFALQFMPFSLMGALYPALSREYHRDRARLRSLVSHGYNLSMLAGMPLGVLLWAFSGEFVRVVFGAAYAPTAAMLGIVAWALPLMFLMFPLSNLLAASNRQGLVTAAAFATAAANLGLNALLIPKMGGQGAAIAMTSAWGLALVLHLAFVLARLSDLFDWRSLGLQVLGHAAAVALLLAAADAAWPVKACIGTVYLAACAWAGVRMMAERRRGQTA